MLKCSRLAIFVVAALLTTMAPAEAKRRVDAFDGLAPKGFLIQNAPTTLAVSDLRGAKIAIIPSQNFLNYMSFVGKWFRPQKYRTIFGDRPTDQNMNFLVHASEPQLLTDRLVERLSSLGAEPFLAGNLPEAKLQGATLFIVFDYYGRMRDLSGIGGFIPFTKSKSGWESTGGIHVLNERLERKLQLDATAMEEYRDSTFLPGMNEEALKWATILSGSQAKFLDAIMSKWDAAVR